MKVPQYRYKSQLFFGDSSWHVYNRQEESPLSRLNPLVFHIGDTQINPALGTSFTKIKAPWLWRYNFNSANTSNYWGSSSIGSNGTTAVSSLGVNVTSGTYYTVGEGNTVEEAYITSGSTNISSVDIVTINFSSYNDWYFTTPTTITVPSSSFNRAIVARFKATYIPDLPDMYTISGNDVTWNTSHPIYKLLEGQECTPY